MVLTFFNVFCRLSEQTAAFVLHSISGSVLYNQGRECLLRGTDWVTVEVTGKPQPRKGHEGPEGELRYNSTLFLTSALDEGGWSKSRSGRSTPGKDPVSIIQEAGWAPGPVWTGAENLAPSGFDPRTVQPVASRCTG
jgi:hypothetical protein